MVLISSIESPELQLWVLTAVVPILSSVVIFWIVRFVKSMDRLTQAVNGINEYISSQHVKNSIYEEAIRKNDSSHREIYKRISQNEKDIAVLKDKTLGGKK